MEKIKQIDTKFTIQSWHKYCIIAYSALLVGCFLPIISMWGSSASMHSLVGDTFYGMGFYLLLIAGIIVSVIGVPHNVRRVVGGLIAGACVITLVTFIVDIVDTMSALGSFGGGRQANSALSALVEQVSFGLPVLAVGLFMSLTIPFKSENGL